MAAVISQQVQQKLDEWKRNLLLGDGRRNNLLSFRTSTSMLRIVEPEASSIYNLLQHQKALTIPLPDTLDEQLDLFDPTLTGNADDGPVRLLTGPAVPPVRKRRSPETLELEADPKKLPSILYRLRLKAQTALNERGVNVLFVAFGQLAWKESDDSSDVIRSPLVLVPVDLSRETLRDPYRLKLLDDDIVLNPVLMEQLRKQFEIDLRLDSDELADLSLGDVCSRVSSTIARKRGWQVDDTAAYLGMFSFLKMSMYKELESAAPLAATNPIIQRLGGESATIPTPVGVPAAPELDVKVPPQNTFHVLDADSSQLEAIVYAKAGGSLVIQGPPGTGKSQTIANIIAECLATNKKVLFVSEKMAALEVVYKRLERVGLADFCLEAHSHKTNKREIIQKLGLALDRHEHPLEDGRIADTLANLKGTRERLNAYVSALHARDNPLKRSVYEIQGEVALRRDAPPLTFPYSGIADLTPAHLSLLQECLHDLTVYAQVLAAGDEHPWHGCSTTSFSFELRDNIAHHFTALREQLLVVDERADHVATALSLPAPANISEMQSLAAVVRTARQTTLPLEIWLDVAKTTDLVACLKTLTERATVTPEQLRGDRRDRVIAAFRKQPEEPRERPGDADSARRSLLTTLDNLEKDIARVRSAQEELQKRLGTNESLTLDGALTVGALAELLLRNPRAEKVWFETVGWSRAVDLVGEAAGHTRVWKDEGDAVRAEFESELLDVAPELLARFLKSYGSFLRFLNSTYRRDLSTLRGLARTPRKLGYREALDELQRAGRVAVSRGWLREHRDEFAQTLGLHFNGAETDWAAVRAALDTTRAIIQSRPGGSLTEKVMELAMRGGAPKAQLGAAYDVLKMALPRVSDEIAQLAIFLPWSAPALNDLSLEDLEAFAQNLRVELIGLRDAEESVRDVAMTALSSQFSTSLESVQRELDFLGTIFSFDASTNHPPIRIDGLAPADVTLEALARWVTFRLDRIDELDTWIGCQNATRRAEGLGLTALIPALRTTSDPPGTWQDGALRHIYRLWLDAQYLKHPALKEFQGELHSGIVERFRQLDQSAVRAAARRVRDNLLAAVPPVNGSASDKSEPGILRHEVGKQKRLKPLRRLFGEIPTLLLHLTPCLMMSPLSLSQFLDPERIRFDVVIFDEASQIRPEDAIGAILRGAQLIVAGDEHQLPPTSFFSSLALDAGDEWDEEAPEVYESVLEACVSAGVPERMLRWHYRSRDESLIAFSNRFIYDGRLVTFPSAHPADPEHGIRFVHVPNGVYERSGKRSNVIEATRVVDLMLEQAERYVQGKDRRSLGVVAFSEAQMFAILQILEKRRRERPDLDPFFEERSDGEAYFVKNLENVQGDERDLMFFSVGYGRDAAGHLTMNFGPLNRSGGERRLNVAITRARDQVVVVSSITGDDIDVSRVKAEGAKLLKSYLDYAEKGVVVLAQGQQTIVADHESPFEEAVARALTKRGLTVHPQVGCAGFRIDLGILHPEKPGRYILGIECDGATYHQLATVRDRDRLRQQVLEGLGWTIHRVWSRDWVKAPEREIERIIEAYQQALAAETNAPTMEYSIPSVPTMQSSIPSSPSAEVMEPQPTPPPRPVTPLGSTQATIPYLAVQLPAQGTKEQFYQAPLTAFLDLIACCVRYEGPMTTQVVRQRVADAWGIERVGTTVAKHLDDAISLAVKRALVTRKGDFLWPVEMTCPPVRVSGDGPNYRGIAEVCPEEIDEAILLVLGNDFACARTELIVSTARLLGYERAKRQVSERIGERVDSLRKVGRLDGNGDQVSLASGRRNAGP